jgi:hypothetical protein
MCQVLQLSAYFRNPFLGNADLEIPDYKHVSAGVHDAFGLFYSMLRSFN